MTHAPNSNLDALFIVAVGGEYGANVYSNSPASVYIGWIEDF
ncbi:MAG TPA: hypothetical protein V6C91_17980 [Coleofasciculaceae cyanobacterium]